MRPARVAAALGVTLLALSSCSSPPTARPPAVPDYEAVVHRDKALALDPAGPSSGRYDLAPGAGAVLVFHKVLNKSVVAYDRQSDWTVAIELPSATTGATAVDQQPAVARVAGEDILYFARKATGTIHIDSVANDEVRGTMNVKFASPERDLIKLGPLELVGQFVAKQAR